MPRALSIKQISYSRSRSAGRKNTRRRLSGKRKKTFQTKENNVLFLSFFLSFFVVACFAFFLYLNLQLVENNFNLREKEQKLSALKGDVKKLEIQIGETLSINELREISEDLNLAKAENIRYLGAEEAENLSLEKH